MVHVAVLASTIYLIENSSCRHKALRTVEDVVGLLCTTDYCRAFHWICCVCLQERLCKSFTSPAERYCADRQRTLQPSDQRENLTS